VATSDESIAIKVQRGDTEAFGVIVDRYEGKIGRYLKKFLYDRDDITDLLQQVFIKAYVNIQSFNTNQLFSPWLYRIAHNEAINFIKKKKFTPFSFFDPDVLLPHLSHDETPEKEVDRVHIKKMIDTALSSVSDAHREILLLHFYEDLSYKEIALVLKIPISSVGVRLQRAKQQLEKILAEKTLQKYE